MTDTCNHTIPDRTPPRLTRTGPSAVHQDRGVKCATGASSKIRGRDNITIVTWNTRTLRPAGKLQERTHEMGRYRWNILGLWNEIDFGETTTGKGHQVFFSAWLWISCSQEHPEHCQETSLSLQQAHQHSPESSPFQHHSSTSVCPDVRLRWQRNRRILWLATKCH